MNMSEAARAWAVLGAGVLAYDLLCPPGQTLSEGADRAMETRLGKAAVLLGTLMVAGHVANLIPEKLDIIHQTVELRRMKLRAVDNFNKQEWHDAAA